MIPHTPNPLPCTGRSRLFDSTHPADHLEAAALCKTCPVIIACRDHLKTVTADMLAGERPVGTWAGLLLRQDATRRRAA